MDEEKEISLEDSFVEVIGESPKARNKDNTPSVLRNLDSIAPPSQLAPRESLLPVLTVPKSYVIWQRARAILIAAAVVSILLAAALITRAWLIGKEVDKTISAALDAESKGSIEKLDSAIDMLTGLIEKHGEQPSLREAMAWLYFAEAVQFGPENELGEKAKESLKSADARDGVLSRAAEAGLLYLGGKHKEALDLAQKIQKEFPNEPRSKLVAALALRGLGKQGEALETLSKAMDASPNYFPLAVIGIQTAVEAEDRENGLKLAAALGKSGPEKQLLESMASVAFSLNPWGGDDIGAEPASKLADSIASLKSKIDAAPPKLARLGRYVEGRVLLASNDIRRAIEAFEAAAGERPHATILAWYGLSVRLGKSADAALRLLDSHSDATSPPILELRVRCLLECGRVDQAAAVLEALEATGALPSRAKELAWNLAVKKGDVAAAVDQLTEAIDKKNILPAIELYYQLKDAGDDKNVSKLAEALGGNSEACAKAMRAWHGKKIGQAIKKLEPDSFDSCTGALAGRLMRGKTRPQRVKAAAELASSQAGAGLLFKINEAMASWLVDGREAAVSILDGVWALKPEAKPLKLALGAAYLEIGLPKRTMETLDGADDPEALALAYLAKTEIRGESVGALVQAAAENNAASPHPALAYIIADAKYAAGKYKDALATVKSALPDAGHWTAELAEIGAKSINLSGDRKDADQLLEAAAEKARASLGIDEWWEIKLARARLNLYRGGKFIKKAETSLEGLKKDRVVDARLFFNLGMAKLRKGKQDDAIEYLKKSVELNPSLGAAYGQLKKLGELDDETAAIMKKVLPGFSP